MPSRNIGLDILRIIAIILITNIHYLAYSGLFGMGQADMSGCNYVFVTLLKSVDYCFLDVFVLITGYFMTMKRAPKRKLVDLWFYMLIVGLFALVITTICFPQSFSIQSAIRTFLPITTYEYWYLFLYGILYLMIPYINEWIDKIGQKTHLRGILFWAAICLFADINPIIKLELIQGNYMGIVWFTYVYIVGSYIRRYGFPIKGKYFNYLGLLAFIGIFAIYYFHINLPLNMKFYSEVSLPPLLISLALFNLFSQIKTITFTTDKLISWVATSSLAVYIVQEQFQFRSIFWEKLAISEYVNSPYMIVNWLLCMFILWTLGIVGHSLYKFIYSRYLQGRVYGMINIIKVKL